MPATTPRHLEYLAWTPNPRRPPKLGEWPFTIPAVRQIIDEGGLDVPSGVTFLVGENGSGKSTLVEAMAAKYDRRGFETPFVAVTGVGSSEEDSSLAEHIKLERHRHASPAGFFLRAEMMHSFLSAIDNAPSQRASWGGERMQARSHGESFLAVLKHRFDEVGVYFLDEPEAALSFRSCLGLIALLDTMRREGSQVIVATHSPLLVSLPGATLLELGEHGIRKVETYNDLALVQDWQHFLSAPARFLKHLVAREDEST
ncbi:MAG: AAA family ATPase [Labilithrix sp.]|nr:AAA family ATPase [Labilithrix sp.]